MKLQSMLDLKSVEVPNDDISLHNRDCKLIENVRIFEFGSPLIDYKNITDLREKVLRI